MPYDPAIPRLDIHTEETRIERDTCTPMLIAALFIITRTWRQPGCPLADEWIGKLWYIYTMEYYSAVKKNTFESVLMRWMKQEPIIQSEVSQSPLEWTGWISLQSKGLSRVFSNTTVQKHQFFGAQLSSQSNSHIHT